MKKRNRILSAVLSAALICTIFAACNNGNSQSNSSQSDSSLDSGISQESTNSEAQSSHYPVTIVTHNYAKEEVEITFDKAPEKVLAFNTNSVENMIALGLTDKILLAFGFEENEILPEYEEEFKKIKNFQS